MEPVSTLTKPMTLHEVRQWFFERGITVTDWARVHGFPREVVYAVLAGRTRGCRGQAHAVAVALGLKKPPLEMAELISRGDQV